MKLPATDPFWSRFKRGPCCEICKQALKPEHDMLQYSPNPPTWYWVHMECHPDQIYKTPSPAFPKGWRML